MAVLCSYSRHKNTKTLVGETNPSFSPLPSQHKQIHMQLDASRGSCSSSVLRSGHWTGGPSSPSGARRVDPCNLGYLAERDAALGFRFPSGGRDPSPSPGLAPGGRAGRRVLINCRIGGALLLAGSTVFSRCTAARTTARQPAFVVLGVCFWVGSRLACPVDALLGFIFHHRTASVPFISRGVLFSVGLDWTCLVPHLTQTSTSILPSSVVSGFFCSIFTRGYSSCCAAVRISNAPCRVLKAYLLNAPTTQRQTPNQDGCFARQASRPGGPRPQRVLLAQGQDRCQGAALWEEPRQDPADWPRVLVSHPRARD